ncbi:hypothetical protein [Mesorhizobium sp. WSM4313]|uniref:hypothetical protein n=1 Tax=Mesorhizobium sp. WSM4313 TaxID=2029412 RepID=UPI000BAF3602|nr:hypothetical protein [Mesorhizobium sp. WSM4313]PBB21123.1 hypothetical protein CK219_00340 [Mesorhizobium sp. WSM4313]
MNALPFGMPAGMDPRTWRQAIEARVNELLDQSMALITALDLMEADCDLEDDADAEPYLSGWSGDNDDREQDNSDDEDDGTAEPTLGAPNFNYNQEHWADGAAGDHEREVDDDREHDEAEAGIADADALANFCVLVPV